MKYWETKKVPLHSSASRELNPGNQFYLLDASAQVILCYLVPPLTQNLLCNPEALVTLNPRIRTHETQMIVSTVLIIGVEITKLLLPL